ncbi:NnrU family protein [Pelagibaculum spongiae]|uniref:NnrU domain-containing protein n=1 Tax=Pelagibaculum spongiae TaxID=2080658 RepID=A0A2V1GVC5_9GAMM|nr:NnrU family protein [Pelagibaculum spongiae]PVZ68291.1 hypothetical protein DC094_13465 [Pelagibaculum spongiae]
MSWLILGLVLFFAVHLLPVLAPGYRQKLKVKYGENRYKLLFGLISIVGLALIILGLKYANYSNLYQPTSWSRHLAMSLMMPSIYLFLSNQALPTRSFIKRLTPNPLNWSIVVWSSAHLMANGDLPQVVLFSSFGLFALISIFSSYRRNLKPARGKLKIKDELLFMGLCAVIYIGLFFSHSYFTGMPLIKW